LLGSLQFLAQEQALSVFKNIEDLFCILEQKKKEKFYAFHLIESNVLKSSGEFHSGCKFWVKEKIGHTPQEVKL